MSKEAMKWYGAQKIADVASKSLLFALAYEAKRGTGESTSSQATLAMITGMTDRSIRATLVILEKLEIIRRVPRNKGKYGRATDSIILDLDRTFDVSRATISAIRKANKKCLPPEKSSTGTKIRHRKILPAPPEKSSGEYYQGYQEESLSVGELSYVRDSGYTREADTRDDGDSGTNVIPFRLRGAL